MLVVLFSILTNEVSKAGYQRETENREPVSE